MENKLIIAPLTMAEARQLVAEIKSDIAAIGVKLLELYEREGWRVLGYSSWRDCVMAEFDFQKSHVYRLLEFARVERNLSPIGEKCLLPANEAQARPLAKLSPDRQRQVWQQAVATAPNGRVTGAHVEQTIRQMANPLPAYFHVEETDRFTCPRCHQRTAQVNGGAICLNDGCRARWASRADYEAEVQNLNQEARPVELLDKERRGRLKAQFAEAVNHLPAEEYARFVERVEELLSEFDLLRIHLNR